MNKKGFTLVELLAVIAILAILVIIALPNVLSMFNSAKQSAFETQVKEIARTAEKEWLKDSITSSRAKVYSKCSDGTCTNLLKKKTLSGFEKCKGSIFRVVGITNKLYDKKIKININH